MSLKAIGKRIKKRRESLGITQKDMANRLGFKTCQFISNIERGVASIPSAKIDEFANILELDINDLTNLVTESIKSKFVKKSKNTHQEDTFLDDFIAAWHTADEEHKKHIKFLINKILGI
jgi:transcriptional regulator with XRE-family HTH domain